VYALVHYTAMDLTLSPSEQAFRDELRAWLADVAQDASRLQAWFQDLVGLLGGAVPTGSPQSLTGTGAPLRARLLDLGPGSSLDLELDTTLDAATAITLLQLGIRLQLAAGPAQIDGGATIVALPLGGRPLARPEAALAEDGDQCRDQESANDESVEKHADAHRKSELVELPQVELCAELFLRFRAQFEN
jgi:hypothetical protein